MSIDEILEKHPWPSLVDPHSAPCTPVPSKITVIDEVVDSE